MAEGEKVLPVTGLARGLGFRLVEGLGILARGPHDDDIRNIDQEGRKSLRQFGVRFGMGSVFIRELLKPAAADLRLALWALWHGFETLPETPHGGIVWVDMLKGAPKGFYEVSGYRPTGAKAVRVDMLERLADAVRPLGQGGVAFETNADIMGLVGLGGQDYVNCLKSLGYRRVSPNRLRVIMAPAEEEAGAKAKGPEENDTKDTKAKSDEKDTKAPPEPELTEAVKAGDSEPEVERERFCFVWAPAKPGGSRAPRGPKPKGKREGKAGGKPKAQQKRQAKPHGRPKKPGTVEVDDDSPFAALKGLRDKLEQKS